MNRLKFATAVAGLIGAGALVSAQTPAKPAMAAQPVADAVRASWESAKKNIRDSAVDVPESLYSFKPVDTVRTFGQIVGHVAGANYEFCSAAKGEKSPKAEDAFEGLATKAAILQAWDDSVAYCDSAFKALTDRSSTEPITTPFSQGKAKEARVAALMGDIGHLNEHYGNLVTYMRIKGIVPPTSRR
jgi:uncharacterized damage-inducible protein DinB